jgi:hypothetical protein
MYVIKRAVMSALGHKQTFAAQNRMSALPLIATAKADIRKTSCPLLPRKQTLDDGVGMSAMGQKRTLLTGWLDQKGRPAVDSSSHSLNAKILRYRRGQLRRVGRPT